MKISKERRQKILKEARSIFLIVFVVLAFRSMFFDQYRVPTGSMIPTIKIGDIVMVNKFAYGFKVPFSDLSLSTLGINWNPIYLFGKKSPERGDVIVFKFPIDPSINFVKRVIGLPGDEIQIIDKIVYINGKPILGQPIDGSGYMQDMDFNFKDESLKFYEYQTGKHRHVLQLVDHVGPRDYMELIVVPQGKYFVMGDNRDFSADSRFWGFVPEENIRGKAMYVLFSMVFPFGDEPFKFRPWRIGTALNG